MAIYLTEFSPDTCTCVVVYEWDDSVPAKQRIHILRSIENRGDEHSGIMDASLFGVIAEENQRKNKALGIVSAEAVSVNPSTVIWSFTAGRLLEISFSVQLSANIKKAIQIRCDTELGLGKVVVL